MDNHVRIVLVSGSTVLLAGLLRSARKYLKGDVFRGWMYRAGKLVRALVGKTLPVLILGAAILSAQATATPIMVSGDGAESCGTWTERHARGAGYALDDWLLGYVTAVNQWSMASKDGNIEGDADPAAMIEWVSNYCQAHPLDAVATAAGQLILEFIKRNGGK